MPAREQYDKAFADTFGIELQSVAELQYQSVEAWDSVGHMSLIAAIEDTFSITFDTDDIIDFSSYDVGKEIMKKYDVTI